MEELLCRYDTRQSFYGKAFVETTKTTYELTQDLYSYGTLVAIFNNLTDLLLVNNIIDKYGIKHYKVVESGEII